MDIRYVQQPLTDLYNRLAKSIRVQDLIVFGLHQSGTADTDSDVDVVVVSEAFQRQTEDDRIRLLDQAAEGSDPVSEAWEFTASELRQAGKLTTLLYACDYKMKYSQMGKERSAARNRPRSKIQWGFVIMRSFIASTGKSILELLTRPGNVFCF